MGSGAVARKKKDDDPRKIAIKVNEQEGKLRELEERRKQNTRMVIGTILGGLFFIFISLLFWGAEFGLELLDFWIFKQGESGPGKWVAYGAVTLGLIAVFLISIRMQKTVRDQRLQDRDPNLGTFITPGGVEAYDKRDYNTGVPGGNTGVVTQVKTYAHASDEGNWEGKVRFDDGVFNCWSSQELTKGVRIRTVFKEGGEPEIEYADDLTDMVGTATNEFGPEGHWLIHFSTDSKFAIGTSKKDLAPGMKVKVVKDRKPGVDVEPIESSA